MMEMQQLARDIETSPHQVRAREFMRWGHEDLLGAIKRAAKEMGASISVHAQVSFDSVLRHGPLHERIKHIRADFVLTDIARFPVAFVDYLGAGYDTTHASVKAALAAKAGLGYLQVPAEWSFGDLKAALQGVLNAGPPAATNRVHGALALQDMLNRSDFGAKAA